MTDPEQENDLQADEEMPPGVPQVEAVVAEEVGACGGVVAGPDDRGGVVAEEVVVVVEESLDELPPGDRPFET